MVKLLLISFALMAVVSLSYACICTTYETADEWYQEILCNSKPDFVGIVTIDSKGVPNYYNRIFNVSTVEVWKGNPITQIATPIYPAYCGLGARPGEKLLVSTTFENTLYNSNECDHLWVRLSKHADLLPTLRNKLNSC